MLKKLCLFLLAFSILLSFSACNTEDLQSVESDIQETNTQETDTQKTDTQEINTLESNTQENDTQESDNFPDCEDPYTKFYNKTTISDFLQSELLPKDFIVPEKLSCFGDFDHLEIYTDGSDILNGYYYAFFYREEGYNCGVFLRVSYTESLFEITDESFLSHEDFEDDLRKMPLKAPVNWDNNSDFYYPVGEVYYRYPPFSSLKSIVWEKDGVFFELILDEYVDIELEAIPNKTMRDLLTESTAPQAAEELYNLWEDALK